MRFNLVKYIIYFGGLLDTKNFAPFCISWARTWSLKHYDLFEKHDYPITILEICSLNLLMLDYLLCGKIVV